MCLPSLLSFLPVHRSLELLLQLQLLLLQQQLLENMFPNSCVRELRVQGNHHLLNLIGGLVAGELKALVKPLQNLIDGAGEPKALPLYQNQIGGVAMAGQMIVQPHLVIGGVVVAAQDQVGHLLVTHHADLSCDHGLIWLKVKMELIW